jgi:hypothetical protein
MGENNTFNKIIRIVQYIWEVNERMYSFSVDNEN